MLLPIDILKDHVLTYLDDKDMHSMRSTCRAFKESLDEVAAMKLAQAQIISDTQGVLGKDVWIMSRSESHGQCSLAIAVDTCIERAVLRRSCIPDINEETVTDHLLLDGNSQKGMIVVTCIIPLCKGSIFIQPRCYFHREMSMYNAHEVTLLDLHVRYLLLNHGLSALRELEHHSPCVSSVIQSCMSTLSRNVRTLSDAVSTDVGMAYIHDASTYTGNMIMYICSKTHDDSAGFLLRGLHMCKLAINDDDNGLCVSLDGTITRQKGFFPGEHRVSDMCPRLLSSVTRWAQLVIRKNEFGIASF